MRERGHDVSDTLVSATAVGLSTAAREFAHLNWTVLPYFLAGAVAGAALQTFLPQREVNRPAGMVSRQSQFP